MLDKHLIKIVNEVNINSNSLKGFSIENFKFAHVKKFKKVNLY